MNPKLPLVSPYGLVPFRDAEVHVAQLLTMTVESATHGPVAYVNSSPDGKVWIRAASGLLSVDQSDLRVRAPLRKAAVAAPSVASPSVPAVSQQVITEPQRAAMAELARMRAASNGAVHHAAVVAAHVTAVAPASVSVPKPNMPAKGGLPRPRPVPRGYSTRAEHTAAIQGAQAHALSIRQKQAEAAAVGFPVSASRASAMVRADRARR